MARRHQRHKPSTARRGNQAGKRGGPQRTSGASTQRLVRRWRVGCCVRAGRVAARGPASAVGVKVGLRAGVPHRTCSTAWAWSRCASGGTSSVHESVPHSRPLHKSTAARRKSGAAAPGTRTTASVGANGSTCGQARERTQRRQACASPLPRPWSWRVRCPRRLDVGAVWWWGAGNPSSHREGVALLLGERLARLGVRHLLRCHYRSVCSTPQSTHECVGSPFCIYLETSAGPEPNYQAYRMSRSTKASEPKAHAQVPSCDCRTSGRSLGGRQPHRGVQTEQSPQQRQSSARPRWAHGRRLHAPHLAAHRLIKAHLDGKGHGLRAAKVARAGPGLLLHQLRLGEHLAPRVVPAPPPPTPRTHRQEEWRRQRHAKSCSQGRWRPAAAMATLRACTSTAAAPGVVPRVPRRLRLERPQVRLDLQGDAASKQRRQGVPCCAARPRQTRASLWCALQS